MEVSKLVNKKASWPQRYNLSQERKKRQTRVYKTKTYCQLHPWQSCRHGNHELSSNSREFLDNNTHSYVWLHACKLYRFPSHCVVLSENNHHPNSNQSPFPSSFVTKSWSSEWLVCCPHDAVVSMQKKGEWIVNCILLLQVFKALRRLLVWFHLGGFDSDCWEWHGSFAAKLISTCHGSTLAAKCVT
jgi:hypothetical protein